MSVLCEDDVIREQAEKKYNQQIQAGENVILQ